MSYFFTPADVFSRLDQACEANPQCLEPINGRFIWRVSGSGGGVWEVECGETAVVRSGKKVKVSEYGSERRICEVVLSEGVFSELIDGSLTPQEAFLSGRLKISGSSDAALYLALLVREFRKA